MTTEILKNKIEQLGQAWEQFKTKNDERLQHIERKKHDPLNDNTLNKIDQFMQHTQSQIESINANLSRNPIYSTASNDEDKQLIKHLNDYITTGNFKNNYHQKQLTTLQDNGAVLLNNRVLHVLDQESYKNSTFRDIAQVINVNTDGAEIIQDTKNWSTAWGSENTDRILTDNTILNKKTIATFELYCCPKISDKLIQDSAIDISSWLIKKINAAFIESENQVMINGDGVGKPKGILSYADGNSFDKIQRIKTGVKDSITADSLINLLYQLRPEFQANANFIMNGAILSHIKRLKDNNGNYLFQPALLPNAKDTLLGKGIKINNQLASTLLDNNEPIIVGDFKAGYMIVDRKGVNIKRDDTTLLGFTRFYTTKQVGADVTNTEALRILKIGA